MRRDHIFSAGPLGNYTSGMMTRCALAVENAGPA